MILTQNELEVIKLTAWCKDIPLSAPQYLYPTAFNAMLGQGYIKKSQCGLSYRLTPQGYRILKFAGIDYQADSRSVGTGDLLTRRLHLAEIVLMLHRANIDVFRSSPPQSISDDRISFLPSFALRRKKDSNILGAARLAGFLYAPDTAFAVYHTASDKSGLYPYKEVAVQCSVLLNGGRPPAVIYTGESNLKELISAVYHAEKAYYPAGSKSLLESSDVFGCPVFYIPMNSDGIRQLRIICQPNYIERLTKVLFAEQTAEPEELWYDALNNQTNEPYLIGFDGNIKRLKRAVEISDGKIINIVLFKSQVAAIRNHLNSINVHYLLVEIDAIEKALGISNEATENVSKPYMTKEGDYIDVSTIQNSRKGRTKGGKQV